MEAKELREQYKQISWQLRQQNYINEDTRKQLIQQLKDIEAQLNKLEK